MPSVDTSLVLIMWNQLVFPSTIYKTAQTNDTSPNSKWFTYQLHYNASVHYAKPTLQFCQDF